MPVSDDVILNKVRNIAVHDYQALQLPITVAIIEKHLDDFLLFARIVLQSPR